MIEVLELPRRDVAARRPRTCGVGQIDIKTMLQRRIRFRSEVPFAEMAGGVACVLQRLGQSAVFRVQSGHRRGLNRLLRRVPARSDFCLKHDLRQMAVRGGDARACRAEARENGGARGRAERTGRVGAHEGHSALREPFDIRRLIKSRVTVECRVRPAKIVGEDEDDIRLRRKRRMRNQEGRQCENEERANHDGRMDQRDGSLRWACISCSRRAATSGCSAAMSCHSPMSASRSNSSGVSWRVTGVFLRVSGSVG